jgi:hypothetical protein
VVDRYSLAFRVLDLDSLNLMVRDRTQIDDIALVFSVSDPDSPKPNTAILLKIVSGSSFC